MYDFERTGDLMLLKYQTVYQSGTDEIIEKKSRFIASVFPVENEDMAAGYIEQIRKKHWNATHNCFAYVIGETFEIQRYSDDGEPGGTAGRPILDVLMGQEIHNALIVVTRYFGGTLLGTGGLVRAYSGAAKAGLTASSIITKIYGTKLKIETDYNGLGKIQYILGQRGLKITDTVYTEVVAIEVLVPQTDEERVEAEIIERTNGQALIVKLGQCFFAEVEGVMKVFEK